MQLDVSSESGYIIATALRGPDFQFIHVRSGGNVAAEELKYIFTARIRAVCGASANGGMVRLHNSPINNSVSNLQYVVANMSAYIVDPKSIQHYLHHIADALIQLMSSDERLCDELLALDAAARQLYYFFGTSYYGVEETIAALEALKQTA